MNDEKISISQYTVLVFMYTTGSSVLIVPSLLANTAKQDGWIACILTVCLSLAFITLYHSLAMEFPDQTIVEYAEILLGKLIGKGVSFLFLFYLYILSSALLREIGDFITTQVMRETPIQVLHLFFMLVCVFGVLLGIEVIGRSSELFFPWVLLIFIALIMFTLPKLKWMNVQPVLEEGFKPVAQGIFLFMGLPFLELVVFLMVIPAVCQKKKLLQSFLSGHLIGSFFLLSITVLCIFVLGVDITARNVYPTYMLGKLINIGGFLQRIEVVVAILWFFTIFFKLSVTFYALTLGLAQLFHLKSKQLLVLPAALLTVNGSIFLSPNVVHFHHFIAMYWTPYSLSFGLFLPLVLLVAAKIRKKRKNLKQALAKE